MSFVKKQILDSLCDQYNQYLRRDLSKVLNLVFNEIVESIARNQRVEIRSFGSFEIRQQKARLGRNPRSGEELEIPALEVGEKVASGIQYLPGNINGLLDRLKLLYGEREAGNISATSNEIVGILDELLSPEASSLVNGSICVMHDFLGRKPC